jgi:hypothetical protein
MDPTTPTKFKASSSAIELAVAIVVVVHGIAHAVQTVSQKWLFIGFILKVDLRDLHRFGPHYLSNLRFEEDNAAAARIESARVANAVIMISTDVVSQSLARHIESLVVGSLQWARHFFTQAVQQAPDFNVPSNTLSDEWIVLEDPSLGPIRDSLASTLRSQLKT